MLPENQIDPAAIDILNRLTEAGYDAYIVGGAVRDLYLGIEPKDYDIATSAHPKEVKEVFGRKARLIGKRFRLVHVYRGRKYFEVSTFRREPTPEERSTRESDDGVIIWRDNKYGNIEQDARRRDFTVNALFYNPTAEEKMVDYVDGVADLDSKTVRAIGDPAVRVAEDPVRILRALKLVGQYDFSLEVELEKAAHQKAPEIRKSSVSRLFEELLKIYSKSYTYKTLEAFHQYGLLQHYLPNLDDAWSGEPGDAIKKLLSERDTRRAKGWYSNSRTLAVMTTTIPIVAEDLGLVDFADLLSIHEGLGKMIKDSIRRAYAPLPVPKHISARARDGILLLPQFVNTEHRNRLLHHPDYMYAREPFSLLTEIFQWDPEMISRWPEKGAANTSIPRSQSPPRPQRSIPLPGTDRA
ncbi:MAG: hypothetical protein R6V56_03870, partial [Lentisphaeria bacterium]